MKLITEKNYQINLFRKLLFCCVFIALLSCSNKPVLNCEMYKNGNFVFKTKPAYGGNVFLIQRQDSIQIETDRASGFFTKLKITWINNCTYEALVLETTFPFSDSIQQIRRTIPLKTEIVAGTNNYYVFKSQRNNALLIMDTMWLSN